MGFYSILLFYDFLLLVCRNSIVFSALTLHLAILNIILLASSFFIYFLEFITYAIMSSVNKEDFYFLLFKQYDFFFPTTLAKTSSIILKNKR